MRRHPFLRAPSWARVATAAGLLLGLVSCASLDESVVADSPPGLSDDAQSLPTVLMLPNYPLSVAARPTTPGAVYRKNLEALQTGLARRPDANEPAQLVARAGAAFEHYQSYGNLDELALAARWSRQAAQARSPSVSALKLWAQIAAYLHQFDEAYAALALLESEGVATTDIALRRLRHQIAMARGVDSSASPPLASSTSALDQSLATADRCLLKGNLECASAAYHQAQFLSVDTNPVFLAWLHTQQGIALLRFGYPDRAIPFFEAALARLPDYYVASEHLAECLSLTGHAERAEPLYRQVIAQTGNPEYMAGYAAALDSLDRDADAAHWQQRAKSGYAQLLSRWPATYAQHAVGFYLESGDVSRALSLAQHNIAIRQDVGSWLLLAEAKTAIGDQEGSCAALNAARKTGWSPPEMAAIQERIGNCPALGSNSQSAGLNVNATPFMQ